MKDKVNIQKNEAESLVFETENKKRVLAISTHLKTTKIVIEKGYFLKRVRETEASLEPSRTSEIKHFAKIVNSFQPSTIFAKRFILEVQLGFKHASDGTAYWFWN